MYNNYYYNVNDLLYWYLRKYISKLSISILSTVCIVCNVQLTEVIIVGGFDKSRLIHNCVCVVDYAETASDELFKVTLHPVADLDRRNQENK